MLVGSNDYLQKQKALICRKKTQCDSLPLFSQNIMDSESCTQTWLLISFIYIKYDTLMHARPPCICYTTSKPPKSSQHLRFQQPKTAKCPTTRACRTSQPQRLPRGKVRLNQDTQKQVRKWQHYQLSSAPHSGRRDDPRQPHRREAAASTSGHQNIHTKPTSNKGQRRSHIEDEQRRNDTGQ